MTRKLPKISIRLHGSLTAKQCLELARVADANGFATCWFAENAFARGILPAAAACASATNRIAIGAGVFNPFSRHPTMMAMEVAALDELSNGRTSLSIGAGIGSAVQQMRLDASKPLVALRDTLAIVRPMFNGEEVNHVGKAFSANQIKLAFEARRDIPIYIAGRGDLTIKLCGEAADGLVVSNMCSRQFASNAGKHLNEARKAAGREGKSVVVQYMPCAVAKNAEEARNAGRRAIGEMIPGFWALSKRVSSAKEALAMGTDIDDDEFDKASESISSGKDPAEVLSNKFTEAFSLTGVPDVCLEQAALYAEAGIDELALTFDGPNAPEEIRLLGEALQKLT
jgi:5,10-methylenetetrahydromethanopterin reductase